MARLGETLRSQRERMGITLEQAAEDTRIREKFLRALESGDHQGLPGAVYTKGFLRNYADYLGLDADELVALYVSERGGAEPPREFEPMRPISRKSVVLTPAIIIPFLVLIAVAGFVAYLYYQFSTFAVPPRIEIVEPAGDTIATSAELVVRGRTLPDARVTIRVFPGPETISDVRPGADGSFERTITLKPGSNHIEVQVLDAAGKVNQATRTVRFEAPAATASPGAALVLEQPANGATVTNAFVAVVGRVATGHTITIGTETYSPGPDGRFAVEVALPAGTHSLTVIARAAGRPPVTETRSVTVGYTTAFVTVRIRGGEAWLQVTVDGTVAPGTATVFPDGSTTRYAGRQVVVRTGNGGTTFVTFNGQDLGRLGNDGQIVERVFSP
ncbi:MAG TPA: helix-turn-helix domain-containing protein [Candidatus Limnocylindria bacterium]|nr:helix-turn-helix domain-containing protein [Candidatus Limnocylindria bacterium]